MFPIKLAFYLVLVVLLNIIDESLCRKGGDKLVVCYIGTWAVYRPELGKFEIENIDPTLCTHIIYSFAGLDETTSSIKSLDPYLDLKYNYGRGYYERMTSLKAKYPHLKVSLAIGGWNEGSKKYSEMASDPDRRKKFIDTVVGFLRKFGFDGLDLDWEYPAKRGGLPHDKENFLQLVKELKMELSNHEMIVTAAIGAGKDTIDVAYDLEGLSKHLDFIHVMCYDYHGVWDSKVGANAPLEGLIKEDALSVEYSIKYLLNLGVEPNKLVLGVPLYGRTFLLTDPTVNDVIFGQTPAQSSGFPGPYTREGGFMGYNEICQELTGNKSSWSAHWDVKSSTPYLRNKEKVISYDNPRSIALKVKLAMEYKLAGIMVWSLDTDDFRGECDTEPDGYKDYYTRLHDLKSDPILSLVLNKLRLKDVHRPSIHSTAEYIIDNNQLTLNIPHYSVKTYPLMRTIHNAILLSEQERIITREIKRKETENEIDVNEKFIKNGGRINNICREMFGLISICLFYHQFL